MKSLNLAVGYVVVSGVAVSALFFVFTGFVAIVCPSSPFKPPILQGIKGLVRIFRNLIRQLWQPVGMNKAPVDPIIKMLEFAAERTDSYRGMMILLAEANNLRLFQRWPFSARWLWMIEQVAQAHLSKSQDTDITEEAYDAFNLLSDLFVLPELHEHVSSPGSSSLEDTRRDLYQSTGMPVLELISLIPSPPNAIYTLLHGVPLPSVVGIRNTILLSKWRNTGMPNKILYIIFDEDGSELESCFASVVDYFQKSVGQPTDDNEHSTLHAVNYLINVALEEKKVPFETTRKLAQLFESAVTGQTPTPGSTQLICNFQLYASSLEDVDVFLSDIECHYRLLRLRAKVIHPTPDEDEARTATEIMSMFWMGPTFITSKSWKDFYVLHKIGEGCPTAEDCAEGVTPVHLVHILDFIAAVWSELGYNRELSEPYPFDSLLSRIRSRPTIEAAGNPEVSTVFISIYLMGLICEGVELFIKEVRGWRTFHVTAEWEKEQDVPKSAPLNLRTSPRFIKLLKRRGVVLDEQFSVRDHLHARSHLGLSDMAKGFMNRWALPV